MKLISDEEISKLAKANGWVAEPKLVALAQLSDDLEVARAHEAQAVSKAVEKERERITTLLQDLIELSDKVNEPAIKVKMTTILWALAHKQEGG